MPRCDRRCWIMKASLPEHIWTGHIVQPCHWPVAVYREELHELCWRYGHDPKRVAWIEYDVIDAPLFRFAVFEWNENDRPYLDLETGKAAMHFDEHLLEGQLPSWWRPSA